MKNNITFIEEERGQLGWSGWYGTRIDHIDTFAVMDGKKIFMAGKARPQDIKNSPSGFGSLDAKWDQEKIEKYKKQLMETDGKYFTFYCCSGFLGESNDFEDPVEFIKWIKENNYTFEFMTDFKKSKSGYWDFSGNLRQYSAAFHFRIYSLSYARKIKNLIKDIKIEER